MGQADIMRTHACLLQDGALSNKELNAFQTKCFSAPLQPEELVGIKKVVADKVPGVSLWGRTYDLRNQHPVSPVEAIINGHSWKQMASQLNARRIQMLEVANFCHTPARLSELHQTARPSQLHHCQQPVATRQSFIWAKPLLQPVLSL